MEILRKLNTRATAQINTGFGSNTSDYGGRFINKNGMPNIEKRGIDYFSRISWYHTMLQMPRWKFLCIILLFYALMNFVFALIYVSIGINHLEGTIANNLWERFGEAYFFSAQTFTTVGYGRISPRGFTASTVAAVEALIGLLSFALATGLFYGRFSKPKAYIRFSDNAVLAPFNNGMAIMMRIAPHKNNNLIDAEVNVTTGIIMEENGAVKNKFYSLDLEYGKVNSLTLSWTIVHPITENSPFYKFTAEDFANAKGEIIVNFKAFDDMFSNTVAARSSYTLQEIVTGARFVPMYHRDNERDTTILELDKLNSHIPADISHAWQAEAKEQSL